MELFFELNLLFFVFLFYTALLISVGGCMYGNKHGGNFYTKIATKYFLGLIIYSTTVLFIYFVIGNFKYSVLISFTLFSPLLFFRDNYIFLSSNKIKLIYLILFIIIILISLLLRSTKFFPDNYFADFSVINPFDGFGAVVHSFRASNISEYIVSSNSIPVLNQNIGQSFISSSIRILFGGGFQAILVFQLAFSMAFTIILFYGLYVEMIGDYRSRYYKIIFLIFIMGSPSLSFFYSSIIDTESIIFLISNSDTLIGLSLFLIFLNYIYDCRGEKFNINNFLFISINAFSWNLFASQNILLLLILFILFFLQYKNYLFLKYNLRKILLVFIFFSAIGSQTVGGFLKIGHTDYSIPGVMSINNRATTFPLLEFRVPRLSEGGSNTFNLLKEIFQGHPYKQFSEGSANVKKDQILASSTNTSQNTLIYFAKIILSIKLVFFPILMIAFFIYFKISPLSSLYKFPKLIYLVHFNYFKFLFESTVYLFLFGIVISSCFIFRGYTFELSKFLNIGLFFIMFLLCIFLNIFLSSLPRIGKFISFLILLFPSLIEILLRTFLPLFFISFSDSLRLLFSLSGTFGLNN